MKKDKNLQVSCEDGDVELLDSLRSQFEFFPPKRSELARVLLRFAMNRVSREPRLLKAISRLFQDSIIADIEDINGSTFDLHTERRLAAAERRGVRREDALDEILSLGGELYEAMGYARTEAAEKQQTG